MCDNFILNNNASTLGEYGDFPSRVERWDVEKDIEREHVWRKQWKWTILSSFLSTSFALAFARATKWKGDVSVILNINRRVSVQIQLAAHEVLFHILGFFFQIRSNTKGGKATLILIFLLSIRLSVQTLSLFSLVFIHLIDDKIWNWSILSNVTKQSDQSVGVPSIFFSKSNSKICRRDLHLSHSEVNLSKNQANNPKSIIFL